MENLYLRPVFSDDCVLLYQWANDTMVRQNSFTADEITYEEHVKWFDGKRNSKECKMFILMSGNCPIGQIRLDYNDNSAIISYSIAKKYRGKGYGNIIIQLIEEKAREDGLDYLYASVKSGNISSIKIFESNLYSRTNQQAEDHLTYTKKL
ncbi:hypothetical protein bsdtb5_38060 [Anaeromicropila herbilytica]|uniref:N-acetyltransferase domain-containing protein n=2 Tax=Anaeromicropila herbilytica TaxID=2785025 RepID=A0A7R7IEX9_9FIRM|nr:hypothetical protein bsdtb5_38060 [Anaeromicropila herbilytica]